MKKFSSITGKTLLENVFNFLQEILDKTKLEHENNQAGVSKLDKIELYLTNVQSNFIKEDSLILNEVEAHLDSYKQKVNDLLSQNIIPEECSEDHNDDDDFNRYAPPQ